MWKYKIATLVLIFFGGWTFAWLFDARQLIEQEQWKSLIGMTIAVGLWGCLTYIVVALLCIMQEGGRPKH